MPAISKSRLKTIKRYVRLAREDFMNDMEDLGGLKHLPTVSGLVWEYEQLNHKQKAELIQTLKMLNKVLGGEKFFIKKSAVAALMDSVSAPTILRP